MNTSHFTIFTFTAFAALSCSICNAQLYDTPEARRQQAEAQEQKKREAIAKQPAKPRLEQKEAEAKGYVGTTFWYLPNPSAAPRILFYEKIPPTSYSQDPKILFTPLTVTSFVVTGVVMPPPLIYPLGQDEYLLQIKFTDGKVGYVNVVGCCGIVQNQYKGNLDDRREYVSTEPAEEILARDRALREAIAQDGRLAKEKAEREAIENVEREAIQKAERESQERVRDEQLAKERAEREERALRENKAREAERKRQEAEQKRREAMPPPRIGMTREQVVTRTNWGKPYDVNRTTTARGTREQWVFGEGVISISITES